MDSLHDQARRIAADAAASYQLDRSVAVRPETKVDCTISIDGEDHYAVIRLSPHVCQVTIGTIPEGCEPMVEWQRVLPMAEWVRLCQSVYYQIYKQEMDIAGQILEWCYSNACADDLWAPYVIVGCQVLIDGQRQVIGVTQDPLDLLDDHDLGGGHHV